MTAPAFAAVLREPDDDGSCSHIYALIKTGHYSGEDLPKVAAQYLDIFCNTNASLNRRRWSGVALIGMLKASSSVAQYFAKLRPQLLQLGSVILSSSEREDIRVVAGLLMRQMLEHGIEYGIFWTTQSIQDSAPNFPQEAGSKWMQNYQSFLDTLNELALTEPAADPSIIYPISMVTSDGLSWPRRNDGNIFALIQTNILTILVLDNEMHDFQFVDIPLLNIRSLRIGRSTTVESQVKATEHEPWDLYLILAAEESTFTVDMTERNADSVTFVFRDHDNASEWQSCLRGHQKLAKQRPLTTPATLAVSKPSSPARRGKQVRHAQKQKTRSSQQHHKVSGQNAQPSKARSPKELRSRSKSEADTVTDGTSLVSSDELLNENTTQSKSSLESTSSKQVSQGEGKLPKVSQAVKMKALKNLRMEDDDGEFEPSNLQSTIKKSKRTSGVRSTNSELRESNGPRSSIANGSKITTTNKTRKRVIADENEDEYVPSKNDTMSKKNTKRKAHSETAGPSTKKARTAKPQQASHIVNGSAHMTNGDGLVRFDQAKDGSPSKRINGSAFLTQITARHTVIHGLKEFQKTPAETSTAFKKPESQGASGQTPSTPSRPRRVIEGDTRSRLQTPMFNNSHLRSHSRDYMVSSPPNAYRSSGPNGRRGLGTRDLEVLSSNSKPIPASPNAESTAISGFVGHDEMAMEKQKGDVQTAQSDPFGHRRSSGKTTTLMRKLTGDDEAAGNRVVFEESSPSRPLAEDIDKTIRTPITGSLRVPMTLSHQKGSPLHRVTSALEEIPQVHVLQASRNNSVEAWSDVHSGLYDNDQIIADVAANHGDVTKLGSTRASLKDTEDHRANEDRDGIDLDVDATLVADNDDVFNVVNLQASPIQFASSPPGASLGRRSSSSHSSTSAEHDPETPHETAPPTSEAEEEDWELSLKPHQRGLHDLLMRTSKQVLRHIVNNETAVSDIADVFKRDGEHVLHEFLQHQQSTYDSVFEDMGEHKKKLGQELKSSRDRIAGKRKRAKSST